MWISFWEITRAVVDVVTFQRVLKLRGFQLCHTNRSLSVSIGTNPLTRFWAPIWKGRSAQYPKPEGLKRFSESSWGWTPEEVSNTQKQGWLSGESSRLPGSIPGPGVVCGLSLLLILYSAPRGFSRVLSGFPPSTNINNSIWIQWMKSRFVKMLLKIPIYYLFYLFIIFFCPWKAGRAPPSFLSPPVH